MKIKFNVHIDGPVKEISRKASGNVGALYLFFLSNIFIKTSHNYTYSHINNQKDTYLLDKQI